LISATSPLSGDEAIVLFALADKESYAFALTREAFDWRRIPLAVAEGRRVPPRKPIPALAAPRRYTRPCSIISTMPRRPGTPIPPSGGGSR